MNRLDPTSRMDARQSRPGLSIVELLVVVAILVAVSAIAVPMLLSGGSRSSSAEDVVDVIDAAVAEARSKSARTGSSASVKLREDDAGLIRVVVAESALRSSSRDGDTGAGAAGSAGGLGGKKDVLVGVIRQSKVRHAGSGVQASGSARNRVSDVGVDRGPGSGSGVMEERTLVVLTPDGAVHPAESARVRLGVSGESVSLSVDEFGGVLLGMSGPPDDVTSNPSRRTTGPSGG